MCSFARKNYIIRSYIIAKIGKLVTKAFSDKFILLTNVSLSISLSGVGDILEQHYEHLSSKTRVEWDPIRTRNMSLSGLSIGVLCHFWYQHLDRLLPGYTVKTVLKKIVVDQFVGSPLVISTFFGTLAVVEGNSLEEFKEEVKHKAWKLYAAEWILWPPAQFINFYLLSTKYRVLFDNSVSLFYDVYTSRVKYQKSDQLTIEGDK